MNMDTSPVSNYLELIQRLNEYPAGTADFKSALEAQVKHFLNRLRQAEDDYEMISSDTRGGPLTLEEIQADIASIVNKAEGLYNAGKMSESIAEAEKALRYLHVSAPEQAMAGVLKENINKIGAVYKYKLSFSKAKLSFEDGRSSQNAIVIRDSYSLNWNNQRSAFNVDILLDTHDISDLFKNVILQEANIPKREIIGRVKKFAPYLEGVDIKDLFMLNKDSILVKGTYLHTIPNYIFEHPYLGVFSINKDNASIESDHALLRVLLIDGKYYFITHYMKPESGVHGLFIYRLDEEVLTKVYD